jgi:hypothetical protein
MKWDKLGLIFCPQSQFPWMNSHAALPVAVKLHGDLFRIFFSTRNQSGESSGAFLDFDLGLRKIVGVSPDPVIQGGNLGLFDDSGISLSCYSESLNSFFYMGWCLPKKVPFSNQIGRAHFFDSKLEKLEKLSRMPIVGKCEHEPFSFGYPWVLKVQDKYFMWYDTNLQWRTNSLNDYRFELRVAVSTDGINWKKKFVNCIEMSDEERAIARPCVIFENGIFKMWYSVNKNGKYRLGYSESLDGIQWIRKDELVGIDVSTTGWDSDEIEYPFVFDHHGKRYMLYNGNSYGKTGFGLAILSEKDNF